MKKYVIKLSFLFLITSVMFFTCKKEDNHFNLMGIIFTTQGNSTLEGASVSVKKQVVQSGAFTNTFSTAAQTTTSANGQYNLSWERENFAALQLICEKDQYITSKTDLDVESFEAGHYYNKNITLNPEAFIHVHIVNNNGSTNEDQLKFSFTNAIFDCACCANGYRVFSGANIDSTFECRLYGDFWLKYTQQINVAAIADSIVNDSIFCPAFQSTNLEITY